MSDTLTAPCSSPIYSICVFFSHLETHTHIPPRVLLKLLCPAMSCHVLSCHDDSMAHSSLSCENEACHKDKQKYPFHFAEKLQHKYNDRSCCSLSPLHKEVDTSQSPDPYLSKPHPGHHGFSKLLPEHSYLIVSR